MERNEYEKIYKKNFVKNKEFELGVCCLDEDYMQESDEYKQVFNSAEGYLKQRSVHDHADSNYYVLNNFITYVERNQKENIVNTWGGFAHAFLLLTWYALRILRAPWRKAYYKIKTFSGHYQHAMHSNFPSEIAEELMERLGYIYHRQQQTFFFHQQSLTTSGSWQETLTTAGMDFFLVHVRCSLSSTQTGQSMPVQDIILSPNYFDALNVSTPLKSSISPHDEKSKIVTPNSLFIKGHNTLAKRHSSPTVPKKTAVISASIGRQQHAALPVKSKRSERSLDADWPRWKVIPNEYVSTRLMYKHAQFKGSTNAGESNHVPSIPWEHRINTVKQNQVSSAIQRRPGHRSNFSDDSGDMQIYEGKDYGESIVDGSIRYPPCEDQLRSPSSMKERSRHETMMTSDIPITRSTRGVRSEPLPGSSIQVSKQMTVIPGISTDNYVSAKPIPNRGSSEYTKILHPPGGRVESGYYSQRSPGINASMKDKYQARANPVSSSYTSRQYSRSTGYENIPIRPNDTRGEYVHVLPPKRRPGDGRPEPQSHIYQEIPGDQWGRPGSSNSKGRITKSNNNTLR